MRFGRRHVVEGEDRIARQTATIARLADLSQDTSLAEGILREMEHTLKLSREHRDRLLRA